MQTETEFKFSLLEHTFPSYDELQAGFSVLGLNLAPAQSYQQHDRYFDSKGRLQRVGMGLRQRIVNGQREITLKQRSARAMAANQPSALHHSSEITVAVPLITDSKATITDSKAIMKWPQEIRQALRGIAFTSRLQCVLELNTHRVCYPVVRSGQELASLCFDEVSAALPASDISSHFSELELEFVETQARHVAKWSAPILEALHKLMPMNASSHNKLERARILLAHSQMMQDIL